MTASIENKPVVKQISDLLVLADWYEERDQQTHAHYLRRLENYCQRMITIKKEELKKLQGKRKTRILTESDINTYTKWILGDILSQKEESWYYEGGGYVANAYGYPAIQTCIFVGIDAYGFPRLELAVGNATKGSSVTTPTTGIYSNRLNIETVTKWASERLYQIDENGVIYPDDL